MNAHARWVASRESPGHPAGVEPIFSVTREGDGGFLAEVLSHDIFTQADTREELRANVREAVTVVRFRSKPLHLPAAALFELAPTHAGARVIPFNRVIEIAHERDFLTFQRLNLSDIDRPLHTGRSVRRTIFYPKKIYLSLNFEELLQADVTREWNESSIECLTRVLPTIRQEEHNPFAIGTGSGINEFALG